MQAKQSYDDSVEEKDKAYKLRDEKKVEQQKKAGLIVLAHAATVTAVFFAVGSGGAGAAAVAFAVAAEIAAVDAAIDAKDAYEAAVKAVTDAENKVDRERKDYDEAKKTNETCNSAMN